MLSLLWEFFFLYIGNWLQGEEREWEIQTSDLSFMKCGSQSIELTLGVHSYGKIYYRVGLRQHEDNKVF